MTRRTAGVRFADTNVFLYAISRASDERRKAETAPHLLESDDLALSAQVLQDFYWDAAIVEAARAQGCRVILSEDLADGQDFAGVKIENPSLTRPVPRRRRSRP